MLWIKSFHLIFVVTWFAGLFYLPRLYVYHAMTDDQVSIDRFKIMERKLFFGITTPSAVLATALGLWLLADNWGFYKQQAWMHAKLGMIVLLWAYHLMCWHYLKGFRDDKNTKTHVFYRFFNEAPVFLLIGIVIMVIVRPWTG